jgi:hypothetical protein
MRKNFTLSLDKESVERLQERLSKQGTTLSGYVDLLIKESDVAYRKFKIPSDVTKMKIGDFLKLAGKMFGELKDETKK